MAGCVDKRKLVDVYFDFTKDFSRASHSTFIAKLLLIGYLGNKIAGKLPGPSGFIKVC